MSFQTNVKKGIKSNKNLLKPAIIILTPLIIVGLFYPFFTASERVEVVKIIDGDTVDVELQGTKETIRFEGVDTPETSGYNSPEEYKGVSSNNWKCLEKWGYNAKDYVDEMIGGKEVTLVYRKGILTKERGVFDRLIAKIYVNSSEKSLNRELVEKGYARSYGDYYMGLEEKARKDSVGVWECAE